MHLSLHLLIRNKQICSCWSNTRTLRSKGKLCLPVTSSVICSSSISRPISTSMPIVIPGPVVSGIFISVVRFLLQVPVLIFVQLTLLTLIMMNSTIILMVARFNCLASMQTLRSASRPRYCTAPTQTFLLEIMKLFSHKDDSYSQQEQGMMRHKCYITCILITIVNLLKN